MPDINDIHRFFEGNLPEYQRKDNLEVMRFFLRQIGLTGKKPIKSFLRNFHELKEFVVFDWLGQDEINDNKPQPVTHIPKEKKRKKKDTFGKCKCGGNMVKRKNRNDNSLFLGCSNWPKCTNTKPFL